MRGIGRGGYRGNPEATVWLGLGANLGDPAHQLSTAVDGLRRSGVLREVRSSALWSGPYLGPLAPQPDYLNLCVRAKTEHSPLELLRFLKQMEREAGRPASSHELPRLLDLDLLLYNDLCIRGDRLSLPHPRMRKRRFVLAPMHELEPGLVLPPDGRAVAELLLDPAVSAQELVRVGALVEPDRAKTGSGA